MSSRLPWVRLHRDALHNPKIVTLSDRQHRAWTNCILIADNNGNLPPMRDIAVHMRMTTTDAEQLICELVEAGLVDPVMNGTSRAYAMHDWGQHQAPSDNAAERMRRHRAKAKSEPETAPKPVDNANVQPVTNAFVTSDVTRDEHVRHSDGTDLDLEKKKINLVSSLPPSSAREARDAKGKKLGVNVDFGRGKGKAKDDGGISTLTKRAEGLGLDVPALQAATEAAQPKNHAAYFTRLCVNQLQSRMPQLPENVIRDALWSKSPAAYTAIMSAMLLGEDA